MATLELKLKNLLPCKSLEKYARANQRPCLLIGNLTAINGGATFGLLIEFPIFISNWIEEEGVIQYGKIAAPLYIFEDGSKPSIEIDRSIEDYYLSLDCYSVQPKLKYDKTQNKKLLYKTAADRVICTPKRPLIVSSWTAKPIAPVAPSRLGIKELR
jgi:hypothetical protein